MSAISAIPRPVQALIDEFSRLPGIGPKTASRLTYFLLRPPAAQTRALAGAVATLKERSRFCSVCFNMTESDPCPLCNDAQRDAASLCVVEEPLDVIPIQRTRP